MNPSFYPAHPLRRSPKAGFALIASLSIMAVLVMIAVALYSMSSVATRSAEIASARTQAQANAKMALMQAVGELQKQMGPDQRISANAAIFDTNRETPEIDGLSHPNWMGVWDSWLAGDIADAPVDPSKYPSAPSHHQTIGDQPEASMRPEYYDADGNSHKRDYFRRWLVSLKNPNNLVDPEIVEFPLIGEVTPEKDATAVRLVGAGTIGSADTIADFQETDYVSAELIEIAGDNAPKGRFAWWVGDQSQKATILADPDNEGNNLTGADQIYRSQAPATMGNKLLTGLTNLTDPSQLNKLANLKSIDLLSTTPQRGANDPQLSQLNFHHASTGNFGVLADVREGGLKRDLNTILEQPIPEEPSEIDSLGDEYMLYAFDDPRFNDRSNSRVPIQDLAAYYQLYHDQPDWLNGGRGGVRYDSANLTRSLQSLVPDYGENRNDRQKYLRQYTSLYRQPVITKVQFLLAIGAQEITAPDRQHILDRQDPALDNSWERFRSIYDIDGDTSNADTIPVEDTHFLRLGIMPVVTLWNPTNLPMVFDNSQQIRFTTPPFGIRWRKYHSADADDYYDYVYFNLNYALGGDSVTDGRARGLSPYVLQLRFGEQNPIVFDPGEVKVFSIHPDDGDTLQSGSDETNLRGNTFDPVNDFFPDGFFLAKHSSPHGRWGREAPEAYDSANGNQSVVFNANDRITFKIVTEVFKNDDGQMTTVSGTNASGPSEVHGAGFNLHMFDSIWKSGGWRNWNDHFRHFQMLSRHGSENSSQSELRQFNTDLLAPGFPGGEPPINFKSHQNAFRGGQLIASSNDNSQVTAMMEFSLSIGSESSRLSNGGFGGGRRITSRPFLHSNPNAAPFITSADPEDLYDVGWDWQLGPLINIEDSIIRGNPEDSETGFYGGGYTSDSGQTHVFQRELPVLPPVSIGAFSHAALGGYSLAYNAPVGDDPENQEIWWKSGEIRSPTGTNWQQITATGQGGLAPKVMQAIGNSYAHPNIPADKSFTLNQDREFDADEGPENDLPYVDHSYLANKALWDEFYFSSITPQPAVVELFGQNKTAAQTAEDFLFNDIPLANLRFKPHTENLTQEAFSELMGQYALYNGGFADKIAAHQMISGPFNINSTDVEAWKVFLASLNDKPVARFESGVEPTMTDIDGTPVMPGMLTNEEPVSSQNITSTNQPNEQWQGGRNLTDDEIEELATAVVKQVKLRGPFLSLSEFINRRLDPNDEDLSLKGALQAALDDAAVSINENFRQDSRKLDSEVSGMNFDFQKAAEGPIAYGSSTYVDQADILRSMASQLTPRGDTFVIRAYGDSVNSAGNVEARVWCEAVVQRYPDYTNPSNAPHLKQNDLTEHNKNFGRQFKITRFRWLDAEEI